MDGDKQPGRSRAKIQEEGGVKRISNANIRALHSVPGGGKKSSSPVLTSSWGAGGEVEQGGVQSRASEIGPGGSK